MAKGRVAISIVLDAAEKTALTGLIGKHGVPQSLAMRAQIVLAAANGLTNQEIAAKLGGCAHTVGVWRKRFAGERSRLLRESNLHWRQREYYRREHAAPCIESSVPMT